MISSYDSLWGEASKKRLVPFRTFFRHDFDFNRAVELLNSNRKTRLEYADIGRLNAFPLIAEKNLRARGTVLSSALTV